MYDQGYCSPSSTADAAEAPTVCKICGVWDDRKMARFAACHRIDSGTTNSHLAPRNATATATANATATATVSSDINDGNTNAHCNHHYAIALHVFCGKTAAILSHADPDLEILTAQGIRNKHGNGNDTYMALKRTRSSIPFNDHDEVPKVYYLIKEFEAHLALVKKEMKQQVVTTTGQSHHHHHHHQQQHQQQQQHHQQQQQQQHQQQPQALLSQSGQFNANLAAITGIHDNDNSVHVGICIGNDMHDAIHETIPSMLDSNETVNVDDVDADAFNEMLRGGEHPLVDATFSSDLFLEPSNLNHMDDYTHEGSTMIIQPLGEITNNNRTIDSGSKRKVASLVPAPVPTATTSTSRHDIRKGATHRQYHDDDDLEIASHSRSEPLPTSPTEPCLNSSFKKQKSSTTTLMPNINTSTTSTWRSALPSSTTTTTCSPTATTYHSHLNHHHSHSHTTTALITPPTTTQTPYQRKMDRIRLVMEQHKATGYSIVRGVNTSSSMTTSTTSRNNNNNNHANNNKNNNNDTTINDQQQLVPEEDDEHFDANSCTQEQMDALRVILYTPQREHCADQASRDILGDQYDVIHDHNHTTTAIFDTSFSYTVLTAYRNFRQSYSKSRCQTLKFDLLLAFTDTIKEYNVWMHDHDDGWGGEKMIYGLARTWKNVLSKPDEQLGLDGEFTRPGVLALLEDLKHVLSASTTQTSMKFNF